MGKLFKLSQTKQLKFPWIVSKKFTLVHRFLICAYNWPIQMTKEKKIGNPYLIFVLDFPCQIWCNVIVRNVFVYQRMNAYKNMLVCILLYTFLKWPVFPSLTKLCKSNWRAKSLSTSNMPQSSSCTSNYMCYLLLFDLERSNDFHKGALYW
jgi:hypothetical protein